MQSQRTQQLVGLVIVAVLVIAGIFWFGSPKLIKAVSLVSYEMNGKPNGKAGLSISFGAKVDQRKMMTAFVDLNSDGKFSDDEKIITNMKVLVGTDKTQGFSFAAPQNFESQKTWNVKVMLDSESFEKKVDLIKHDFGSIISLDKVKHPAEANLGFVDTAYAQPTVDGHCDAEWNAIQSAYDAAMKDISNDKLYNNYKTARKNWDDCFKKYREAVGTQQSVPFQDMLAVRPATQAPPQTTPTPPPAPQVGQTVERPKTTEKPGTSGEQAAQADNGDVVIDDVPHLVQKDQECGPTSIAANLTALAKRNGQTSQDTGAMIEELKKDLFWTFEDGVLNGDMITGKAKYAQEHGWPVQTNIVGDGKRSSTPQDISDALKGKGMVEQRILFVDGNGTIVGAHIVSAVGASPSGDVHTVTFNDPMSEDDTNSFVVDDNGEIENYSGAPEGTTAYMGLAWVQTWGTTSLVGMPKDTMEEAEIQGAVSEFGKAGTIARIQVLVSGDHKIPIAQVYLSQPGQCRAKHWHSVNGRSVTDIEGNVIPDHEPCGYGKQSESPVEWIPDPNFVPPK